MWSATARRSASVADSPFGLGEHSVGLVNVDIPPKLAEFQILVTVAEAAQAMTRSDTDFRLVTRLVFVRGLGVA